VTFFVKDKSFYRKLLTIAIPVALQGLITFGVNMTDTIMLGSFGEIMLSGSSLANSFYSLFHILCLGLCGGSSVICSQYWGKQDKESVKKMVSILLKMTFLVAVGFMLLVFIMPGTIMSIFTNEKTVIEAGVKYFSFLRYAFIFHGLSLAGTAVLRSIGVVQLPLFASICSFTFNIFFNWMFIFGKLGAPRMEIAGAAVGTLLARIIEFMIIIGYLLFKDKQLGFRLHNLKGFSKDIFTRYYKTGLPVLISDAILALGNNAVAIIIGQMGSNFVAANSITQMVVQIISVFSMALSNAASVITGKTIGEGKKDEAYHQGVTFFVIAIMIGIVGGIIIYLLRPLAIDLYNVTDETKAIANQILAAVSIIFIFQAQDGCLTKGVLRGGGDTKFLMFADVAFLWIASIPLGIITGLVLHLPPSIVYVFLKIDLIIKAIICIKRLFSKQWIKDVTILE